MTVPYEFMMTTHLFLHTDNYQPHELKAAVAESLNGSTASIGSSTRCCKRARSPLTGTPSMLTNRLTKKKPCTATSMRSTITFSAMDLGR